MKLFNIRSSAACVLLALLVSGCGSMATRNEFYEPITAELRKGQFDRVVERLDKAHSEGKLTGKDRFLYYMDAGLANFYAGRYDSSFVRFAQAEETAEELYTKSISKAALSLLLNDNALDYAGEDFEILYANLFSAMDYLALDRFDDAFVEIRRANQKLNLLEQKYANAAEQFTKANDDDENGVSFPYEIKKVRFNNDAFARWLSMHLYAADGKMDDARIDFDFLHDAFVTQPHIYPFTPPDVQFYSQSAAIISVVGLAGLSPVKESVTFRIRTDKDLNLVQVLYTNSDGNEAEYSNFPLEVNEDYYFKFAMPTMVPRQSDVAGIRLFADSRLIGHLQIIEDVTLVASETFEAKKSLIYFRALARAVVKGLAVHKALKKADTGGVGGWFKKAAIEAGSDITENADLRGCQFLPGLIFVGDFEIEPGTYDLAIEFLGSDGQLLKRSTIEEYRVVRGDLNFVHAFFAN